jgi:endogenous inhibitor of DNA gyrase (YacG/DUF329 family)
MADEMKTYEVECPVCNSEFDADIQVEALLPDAESFSVECPECGEESEITYDAATDTVTLEDTGTEDEGADDEE